AISSLGCAPRLESAYLLGPATRFRDLASPHSGSLFVGHVHDGQSAQELLALDVGPVGEQHGAARSVGAEDRAVLFLQTPGEDVSPGGLDLVHDSPGEWPAPAEPLLGVVTHPLLVEVDEVLGHVCSLCSDRPGVRLHLRYERRPADPTLSGSKSSEPQVAVDAPVYISEAPGRGGS